MQVGNLTVPEGAAFAPMAGFTDSACRHLMARHGAAYTVSEMASAKAISYGDEKSLALLRDHAPAGLYAVQLFGAEPEILAKAVRHIKEKHLHFDMLDLNMGCPAPKITAGGAGSRLMLSPALCGALVAAAKQEAGDTPVTVKMRLGWDDAHRNAPEVARCCEAAGAALIAVHGRTKEQLYTPPVDAAGIAEVKRAVGIPVLANGDITTAEQAVEILAQTGCDGVMVGRAALGDPWLFERIRAAVQGQLIPPPATLTQKMAAMRSQIYAMCEEKGERVAMAQARGQAMHYMVGLRNAAELRHACAELAYFDDVDRMIEKVHRLQRQ